METEKNFDNMQEDNNTGSADPVETISETQNAGEAREQSLRLTRKFMKVTWLLNRYHQQKRSEVGPMGDPYRGQGRILALLKLQPGISQSELAYLLGMRPQSAGELLAKLERASLVERTQSETDKRVLHVKLTSAGERATEQRAKGKGPFAMLSNEEKETLRDLLEKVAVGLEEQVGEAPEGPFGRGPRGGQPDRRGEVRGWGDRGSEGRGGPRRGPGFGPNDEMFRDPQAGKDYGPRRGRRFAWGKMRFQVEEI